MTDRTRQARAAPGLAKRTAARHRPASRLGAIALALAAFAVAGAGPAAAQAPQKLRLTLQLPITSHLGTNLTAFEKMVETETGGRIDIEIVDKAQLYRDNEVIGAVASGKIEMGTVPLNQFARQVPAVDIFGQPFMFNLAPLLEAATSPDNVIRQRLDEAIGKATGTQVLWWQPYGSTVFFSRGKDGITVPKHMAGQNVRVISTAEGEFITQCNAKPSRIPGSKQHAALKDGTVDMGLTGVTGVKSRKLYEVTDTITKTNHSAIEFIVIINGAVWAALSSQDRAIITKAARAVETDLRTRYGEIEEAAYAFAREKSMTIVEVEPNDLIEWRACSAAMVDDFLQRSGELGQKLMADYGRLRLDPCCSGGPKGKFTRH